MKKVRMRARISFAMRKIDKITVLREINGLSVIKLKSRKVYFYIIKKKYIFSESFRTVIFGLLGRILTFGHLFAKNIMILKKKEY